MTTENELEKLKFENRVLRWMALGGAGLSSKFMCKLMTGIGVLRPYEPLDIGDFRRCVGLLEAIPELRSQLNVMREHGPVWAALAEQWEELELLLKASTFYPPNRSYINFCTRFQKIHEDVRKTTK